MNNLFIIHTQYNLLLACGLCMNDFKGDKNDLIIFCDFNMSEIHRNCMKNTFRKIQFLKGIYPDRTWRAEQKLNKIRYNNKIIKNFISSEYERVFIVDDMCIEEMYALKCVHKKNKGVKMAWLEDGANAYFSNSAISGGMGATPLRRFIRKIFFSTLFGLWRYYDLGCCMGAYKLLKQAYLTFPRFVRAELSDKELIEISDKAFKCGMQQLFHGEAYAFEENGIIIAMDKLDVYGKDFEKVSSLISDEVLQAHNRGQKIYYKYHPRETQEMLVLQSEVELDRKIALESYLTNSNTRNLTIIGVKSTSLQTAKKMGYEAVSFIQSVEPENRAVIDFYKKIHIKCV